MALFFSGRAGRERGFFYSLNVKLTGSALLRSPGCISVSGLALMHPTSPTSPNNSPYCRKMHPKVICNLLVRVPAGRVSRKNGIIPVWCESLNFG